MTTERLSDHTAVNDDGDDDAGSVAASASDRYRALTRFVETHRPDLVSPDNTELLSLVQQANQLPCADQTPTERLLDARLFRSLTRCGNVKARRLSFGDAPQSPLELVLALREKYKIEQPRISLDVDEEWVEGGERNAVTIDWARLGEDLTQMWHMPPGMKCMKGFMKEVEKKKRVVTVRKREKPSKKVLKPEKHAARELTASATETERNVHRIWSVLQKEDCTEGIPFAQLALDPESYPQTVVNAFNVMFLVKDLRVEMRMDERKALMIKPIKQHNSHKRTEDNRQTFVSMRPRLWRKWREGFAAGGVVQNGNLDRSQDSEPVDNEAPGPSTSAGHLTSKGMANGKTALCDVDQVETVDVVAEDEGDVTGSASKSRRSRRSNGSSQSGKLARRRLS